MNLRTCSHLTLAILLWLTAYQNRLLAADSNEEARQIAVLESPAADQDKDAACVWLKRHGTAESVPALAGLLTQEALAQSARYALESMAGPAAGQALIDALPKTTGLLKIGLINSLEVRRETSAVAALTPLLADSDAQVAAASAAALGDIATADALRALQERLNDPDPSRQRAALDACLRCAQHRLESGQKADALAIYRDIYQRPVREFYRVAAFRGLALSSGDRAAELLANGITNGPPSIQMEALQLVHEKELPGITGPIVALLPAIDPLAQVALIEALTQRGDPSAVPEFVKLAKHSKPGPRTAAVGALGTLGSDADVAFLVDVAATAGDPAQAAARQSLGLIRRGNPTATLLSLLPSAPPAAAIEIIRALSVRSASEAAPTLLQLATQQNDAVRQAAFQALGRLIDQPRLEALVQLVGHVNSLEDRAAAAESLRAACQHLERLHGSVDLTPVTSAFKSGSADLRLALLPVAAGLTDPQERAMLRAGVADPDARVRAVALRIMCDATDAELLPDIQKVASQSSDPDSRAMAIEACVRLATREDSIQLPLPDQIHLFDTIMPVVHNPAEKRVVLSGLAVLPDPQALHLAQPLLADATVSNEAAQAVITICRNLPDTAAATNALNSLMSACENDDIRRDAASALKAVQARADSITAWQFAGPYRQAGKDYRILFDTVFPPESADAQKVAWRPLPVNNDSANPGILDLLKAMGGQEEVAYARTSIHTPTEQPAWLLINSDDGVKVWLNGQMILAHNLARAITSPPDKIKITLKAGWNALLLKVTQHNAGWGFSVRLTDLDGSPLQGLQVAPSPAEHSR